MNNSVTEDEDSSANVTLGAEIEDKLKGDAIGETMYTQRFVLKTLLKLKEIEWNEQLEDDLCFLWDSTVEKDVCEYLMRVDFPSIVCNIILENNPNEYGRLIEILVGIISNILSAKCDIQLSSSQIDTVLNLIVSTDSLILVQLMRFLTALSYMNKNLGFLTENRADEMLKFFKFVLESSTNFELIQKTLEAIAKMSEDSKTKMFFDIEILKVAINSCVRAVTEDGENDFELFSIDQRNSVKFLLEFISNFAVQINSSSQTLSEAETEVFSNTFMELLLKLTKYYSVQENLLPITDELIFYFEVTNYLLLVLKVNYNSKLFKNILEILRILIDNQCENINEFIETFCYLIIKGNSEKLRTDLSGIKKLDVEKVLTFVEKQQIDLSFEFNKKRLKELYS